jgi:sugar phosphate isomerase/epimerase
LSGDGGLSSRYSLSLHPCTVGWRVAWPELAELAAAIGYEGAVIARDQPLPVDAACAVRATAMLLPAEVRRDEATYRDSLTRLRPNCEFARSVGCRVATLGIPPSSELPFPQQARLYRERLKPCCEVLDEFGIRLAIECITPLHLRRAHPYEFPISNLEMLEFGLTVSPGCGLIVDAWHWHHAGSDPKWLGGIPRDRILDVHISDSPDLPAEEIRDTERVLPGEGVVDFEAFFDLLGEAGYEGPLTVEIFSRELNALDPAEAARIAFVSAARVVSGNVRNRREA